MTQPIPNSLAAELAKAVQAHQAGNLQLAESGYRRVLAQQPRQHDALHLLGVLAAQAGHPRDGIELINKSLAIVPNVAAYLNVAKIRADLNEVDAAIAAYRAALSIEPGNVSAHIFWAELLIRRGDFELALEVADKAVRLAPTNASAHNTRGVALRNLGRNDEAIEAYHESARLDPNWSPPHNNLGNVLRERGELEAARAAFERSVTGSEVSPEAHLNLALTLLSLGDFARGWREYEWRFKAASRPGSYRNLPGPAWNASLPPQSLKGRTILLHTEQGFGDAIQFFRFAPIVAAMDACVILECPRSLYRVFKAAGRGFEVIARGDPLPRYDLHCPLMSLPLMLGTTLESIPSSPSYLAADPGLSATWASRLPVATRGSSAPRIGVVWRGSAMHMHDRWRSMSLNDLAPLGATGATIVSLQKEGQPTNADPIPRGMHWVDWTSELADFADSAALISQLDLVVSVDTAVCHLAAAMGKPTWTLLASFGDWRWLRGREDSPWYPSMRLFRQRVAGDWSEPMTRVVNELRQWWGER